MHIFQFQNCSLIARLSLGKGHIYNQENLLQEVVKTDYLVKEHQVQILEVLLILSGKMKAVLLILDKVIGKVSNQSSGKGRGPGYLGRLVLLKDLPD